MKQLLAWTEVPTPRSPARPSWPWLRNSTLDRRSACRSPARVELCKSKRAPLGQVDEWRPALGPTAQPPTATALCTNCELDAIAPPSTFRQFSAVGQLRPDSIAWPYRGTITYW